MIQVQSAMEFVESDVFTVRRPLVTKPDVRDVIYPTNNLFDVPLLELDMQATEFVAPVTQWRPMRRPMPGTWHFYFDDWRFAKLWDNPIPVVNSQCYAVVEPNFSTSFEMPRVVALWGIYRKRWLARWWAERGVKIFVDLWVSDRCADDGDLLLGVPKGWRAYACRGSEQHLPLIERRYQQACERAGTSNLLMWIYGGGPTTRDLCRQRGWPWVSARMPDIVSTLRALYSNGGEDELDER